MLGGGRDRAAAGLAAFVMLPGDRPAADHRDGDEPQPDRLGREADAAPFASPRCRRAVDAARVLQLWALPPGATAPTSLGLIPAEGRVTVTPETIRPQAGMLIEISLEPPGGSTTGRPTGPVLFIGRLSAAGAELIATL